MVRLHTTPRLVIAAFAAFLLVPGLALAEELILDGGFEAIKNGKQLRMDNEGQDWYESRKDREGRKLLMLSTKKIRGNATQKAMLKADPELNTYLSQRLAAPVTGAFTASYDVCVKLIRPEYDRSAFFFCGESTDKKNGPNSTGKERWVFLGFENAGAEGKINLFAREADKSWDERTILARDLDLMTWYTITVDGDVAAGAYTVTVGDGAASAPLQAFKTKKKDPPAQLTHVSFATWNDGAGTFYVDNVSVRTK